MGFFTDRLPAPPPPPILAPPTDSLSAAKPSRRRPYTPMTLGQRLYARAQVISWNAAQARAQGWPSTPCRRYLMQLHALAPETADWARRPRRLTSAGQAEWVAHHADRAIEDLDAVGEWLLAPAYVDDRRMMVQADRLAETIGTLQILSGYAKRFLWDNPGPYDRSRHHTTPGVES